MNLFWPFLACVSVVLVGLFEVVASKKERTVRLSMLLQEGRDDRHERYVPRVLLFTVLGSLSVAFGLYVSHVKWSVSKNSVAVVFDAGSSSIDNSSFMQQKGALQELMKSLQDIPLSLYQYKDGYLSCLVPPTIDRLYVSLIADGMLPSSGESLSLDAIQKEVFKKEANTTPWIVVISPQGVPEGASSLDGVSLIVPRLPEFIIKSFERGRGRIETSFGALTTRITSRILRSEEIVSFDWFEKLLVIISLGGALLACVQWRRRVQPLFWLSLLCLNTGLNAEYQASSENAAVRQYMDLVEEREYRGASQHLEELLPSIANPRARERIFYDLALSSYLQEEDMRSLSWLKTGQVGESDVQLAEKAKILRVLALSRLVRMNDTSEGWRGELKKLLDNPIGLPRSIFAEASLSLFLPPDFSRDEMKTLLFYVQALTCVYPLQAYEKESFRSLVLSTQKSVENGLKTHFSKRIDDFQSLAARAREEPFLLYRYLLWNTVSKQVTEDNALQYLLDEALQTATEKLYFPRLSLLLDEKMADIALLLDKKVTFPKEETQESLSAAWYVKAKLWDFVKPKRKEQVVLFVGSEMEKGLPLSIQMRLAKELISLQHLPKGWYSEEGPLSTLFWMAFLSWSDKDSLASLDWLLSKVEKDRIFWEPYLVRFFLEKKFFSLSLEKGLNAYDLVLLGKLVSIEKSPCSTQEEGTNYVARLLVLYRERLGTNETLSNTLGVIMGEQPKMAEKLVSLPVFKDDYTRRTNFENLIDEWTTRSQSVERLVKPFSSEKGVSAQRELRKCYDVLVQIHQMLDEREPTSEEQLVFTPAIPQEKHFAIREEEAVRLYQEMDRMDRALYGE